MPASARRSQSPARLAAHHERIRRRGINKPVYWVVRALLQPALHVYFRLRRTGRQHIPAGPVILASNHRSFLDPFVIGCCVRRPIYFVAKQELFAYRPLGWLLNCLGAFPVRRGESDLDMMETARQLLERGEAIVIFPEGTRHRDGPLRRPKRGLGRLALQSGAPVVPVAVIGTARARRGPLVRPVKVSIRCGRPLSFPRIESPARELAAEVTERVWPCVELQWAWLGGAMPEVPAAPEAAPAPAQAA